MDALQTAQRMMREYGDHAEDECDARSSYHQLNGDLEDAARWRILKQAVILLRQQDLDRLG